MTNLIIDPVEQIQAAPSMKQSYQFLSTKDLVTSLESKGWSMTSRTSVKNNSSGFQKHLLKFNNETLFPATTLSNNHVLLPQIVVMNAHNGTSALRFFAGFLRLACLNGIIAGQGLANYRIIHNERMAREVVPTLNNVIDELPKLLNYAKEMSQVQVDQTTSRQFIEECYHERFKHNKNIISINYDQPLYRHEDKQSDLFTLFNRTQEMIINGGIKHIIKNVDPISNIETQQFRKSRKLASATQNVALNRFIWDKALNLLDKAA